MAHTTIATVVAPASYLVSINIVAGVKLTDKQCEALSVYTDAVEANNGGIFTTVQAIREAFPSIGNITEPITETVQLDIEVRKKVIAHVIITPVLDREELKQGVILDADSINLAKGVSTVSEVETPFESYQRGTLEAVEGAYAKGQIDLRKPTRGTTVELSNLSQALNTPVVEVKEERKKPTTIAEMMQQVKALAAQEKAKMSKEQEAKALAEQKAKADALAAKEAKAKAEADAIKAEATRIAMALSTFQKDFSYKIAGVFHTRTPKATKLDAVQIAPHFSVVRSGAYAGLTCNVLVGKCMVLTTKQMVLLRALYYIYNQTALGNYVYDDATVKGVLMSEGRIIESTMSYTLAEVLKHFTTGKGRTHNVGSVKHGLEATMQHLMNERPNDAVALVTAGVDVLGAFVCQQYLCSIVS